MNTKLLRKLLAGLLVCAMLLASVAAFADDEVPVEPTTAPAEDTVDQSDSTDPVTPAAPAAPSDPADDVDENDDATVDEDEDVADEDEDNVDEDEDIVDESEDDVDEDVDNGNDTPVVPPIIFGAVPVVDGEETEEEDTDANADNGIDLAFFHKHDHQYVNDNGGTEPEYEYGYSDYEWYSEQQHVRRDHYYAYLHCKDYACSDDQEFVLVVKSEPFAHVDADHDEVCDDCLEYVAPENAGEKDANDIEPEEGEQLECEHANATWSEPKVEVEYDRLSANYNTKTDQFEGDADGYADASVGHMKHIITTYKGECKECGAVKKVDDEYIYEPHSFKNGKCACGYKKPTTAKKKEDTRVRMGVKLMQEIRELVAEGATVNIYNEALAYTDEEFAAIQAVTDPFERMLMMLAALGYGDEVEYAIKTQGLEVSDAALALIDQLGDRDALPGAADAFLSTEKVNGTDREVVTISLVVSGNGVVTKSYTFYKDGSNFYFFE